MQPQVERSLLHACACRILPAPGFDACLLASSWAPDTREPMRGVAFGAVGTALPLGHFALEFHSAIFSLVVALRSSTQFLISLARLSL